MEPKREQWSSEHGGAFAEPGVAEAYRHRPPYPPATFALLRGLLAPDMPAHVLDAGCGTGFIARPLAPLVARVDAVDIAPSMVSAGQREPGGDHPHIRWLCSPMETFAGYPPYALIVAGASLHWMDWAVVLPRFASWLGRGGVLALVDELTASTGWEAAVGAVIARHSTNRSYQPYTVHTIAREFERRGLFRLSGSERIDPVPHSQPLAAYIESFHARSGLTRPRMGAAADRFDAELRAAITPHCPDRVVHLQVGAEVLWGLPLPAT